LNLQKTVTVADGQIHYSTNKYCFGTLTKNIFCKKSKILVIATKQLWLKAMIVQMLFKKGGETNRRNTLGLSQS